MIGTLEFVGPDEKDDWPLAGTIVPIAYIAWSLWLVALGVVLLQRRVPERRISVSRARSRAPVPVRARRQNARVS